VRFSYEKDAVGIVTATMDMEGQSANTMTPAYHLLVVRLTNLLGLQSALPHLLYGQHVSPREALERHLVDSLCACRGELIPAPKAWTLAHPDGHTQPSDNLRFGRADDTRGGAATIGAARSALLPKLRRVSAAAERIFEIAAKATELTFDAALHYGWVQFCTLIGTVEAKAAISIFFAANAIRSGKLRPAGPKAPISYIAVIGVGASGTDIADLNAGQGIPTVLVGGHEVPGENSETSLRPHKRDLATGEKPDFIIEALPDEIRAKRDLLSSPNWWRQSSKAQR
jgi:hypothetical protein